MCSTSTILCGIETPNTLQYFQPLVHFSVSFHALHFFCKSCTTLPCGKMFLIPLGFISFASYGLEALFCLLRVGGCFGPSGSLWPMFSSVCAWRLHLNMGTVSVSCLRSKPAMCRAAWRQQPLLLCYCLKTCPNIVVFKPYLGNLPIHSYPHHPSPSWISTLFPSLTLYALIILFGIILLWNYTWESLCSRWQAEGYEEPMSRVKGDKCLDLSRKSFE